MQRAMTNERTDTVTLFVAVAFIILVFLLGGASRGDALSQPLVRLLAILAGAYAAWRLDAVRLAAARLPLAILGALALVMVVQIVPLPPALWTALPGQATYVDALQRFGLADGWRTMSLTPDRTLNALLALAPPLAAVLIVSATRRSLMATLLAVMIAAIILSGFIGVLQVSSGSGYLYRITNQGSAVGLFANRNHQALMLAVCLPMLAAWAILPQGDRTLVRVRFWLALCVAAGLYPLLLITGSRAGLVLGVLATLLAAAILVTGSRLMRVDRQQRRRMLLLAALPVGLAVAAVAATMLLSRDLALQRLIAGEENELRFEAFSTMVAMARDFAPLGTGFGAFDAVYRMYEPVAALDRLYLNHAHADWLELVIEGGVPAMLVAIAALGAILLLSWRCWTARLDDPSALLARLGSAILLLVLAGSVTDYPLRTPTVMVVAAIALLWLCQSGPRPAPASDLAVDGR